ncbi:MAG: rhomboid family intramembrane serine protease [Bacteroidota bacterium]
MPSENLYSRLKGFPPVVFLLILSCCVITIPLLIQPKLYEVLGCDTSVRQFFWQYLTSSFAHGAPVNPVPPTLPHFLGNALMIALLGAVIERVLGSGRFLLLTLATLATHTIWKTTAGGGNGASGFCWGYTVFIVPILYWEWRQRRKEVLRDPLYLGLAALTAFALFGVAAVLSAMGRSLWNGNGTNQAHAYSILTALPFAFFWYKTMRENWRRLGQGEPIEGGRSWLRTAALGAGALLLAFNSALAGLAASGRVARPVIAIAVDVTPPSGDIAALNAADRRVLIRFNRPMAERVDIDTDILWQDEKGPLSYTYRWIDPKTLAVVFTREIYPGETIRLVFYVKDAAGWDKERVEIKYPLTAQ